MEYNKEILSEVVKNNYSIAGCLRTLNIRAAGGNYKTINKYIKEFGIDTSHFSGQGWNKGKTLNQSNRKIPLEKILIENSTFVSSNHLKKRLFKEGVKTWECEQCNRTEWNEQQIPLELEHCNGDNTDNRIENLKFLCPNCHAQTEFWRGRNIKVKNFRIEKEKLHKYCDCGLEIKLDSLKCKECYNKKRQSMKPKKEQLILDFEQLKSYVQVGKKYGVSDNSVRKWMKSYNLQK